MIYDTKRLCGTLPRFDDDWKQLLADGWEEDGCLEMIHDGGNSRDRRRETYIINFKKLKETQ